MDELTMLRQLAVETPLTDATARAEVWKRLSRRRRFALGIPPRIAVAAVVAGIAAATVALTFRGGAVGVDDAKAACVASAQATSCLHTLAELAGADSAASAIVYQRRVEFRTARPVTAPVAVRPFNVGKSWVVETLVHRTKPRGERRSKQPGLWFPTTADRAAWRASGSPSWREMFGSPLGAGQSRVIGQHWIRRMQADGRSIPTDPEGVIQLLRSEAAKHGHSYKWGLYYGSLDVSNPLLTPAQRVAIFEALARSPNIRSLGRMRDPLGRVGFAIGAISPGQDWKTTWITLYDPHTGRLLADGFRHPRFTHGRMTWLHAFTVGAAPRDTFGP